MIVAAIGTDTFVFKFFLLLHLLCVIVGFGSTFVYPMFAAGARSLDPAVRGTVGRISLGVSKKITTPFIYAAGAFGIVLVVLSDKVFKFSQAWISVAFVLFIIGILVSTFVHYPNLKAMNALSEKLTSGAASPPAGGGPPPEVAELEARGKRVPMYSGILHLLFLLIMIDMIWKPGL